MESSFSVAFVLSGLAAAGLGVIIATLAIICGFGALIIFWWREITRPLTLARFKENPILGPKPESWWESEAVFNPAAVYYGGKVHLFYRAIGRDGISRIGYASSKDGINFERLPHPVFELVQSALPYMRRTYAPLTYNPQLWASGGGWGGCEDPRAAVIDGRLYMTFSAFEGWDSVRMTLTSLLGSDLSERSWRWRGPAYMSPPGQVHKNWVLFPEKIGGKFAVLHSLSPPKILIDYFDSLEEFDDEDTYIHGSFRAGGRTDAWDGFVRGAGSPPIKTPHGWLLLYRAMDPRKPEVGYKLGAMLTDLQDPTKILFRSSHPVLEPKEWYENDWKPGVLYVSGAVVVNNDLIIYYGGGDKHVAAARAKLEDFVRRLMTDDHAILEPVTS